MKYAKGFDFRVIRMSLGLAVGICGYFGMVELPNKIPE